MKDGQKRLGINYQYFTVLAIKGLQEQQQQIQTLEQRIAALEALVKKNWLPALAVTFHSGQRLLPGIERG